jgi:Lanthionine synthetase C-like protein
VEGLEVRRPDDPDARFEGVWSGLAGVLAVAERRRPDVSRRDRLAELAFESLGSSALEPMLGHPGHMLLAAGLHARTGEERWAEFWAAGTARLLQEWRHDDGLGAWLWTQQLGKNESRYLGAAHVVTAMWEVAPDDDEWTALLLAAGRLVWEAGPLRDAPGLCHGTAGNAYPFLALWRRTGEEEWLYRARAFARHAAAQIEDRAARCGHGWHSLFTGDEGVGLCLASCLAPTSGSPSPTGSSDPSGDAARAAAQPSVRVRAATE